MNGGIIYNILPHTQVHFLGLKHGAMDKCSCLLYHVLKFTIF